MYVHVCLSAFPKLLSLNEVCHRSVKMRLVLYLIIRVFGSYFYKIVQILQGMCPDFYDYGGLLVVKGKSKAICVTGHGDP
jgi:hypothetical protein